MNKDLADRCLRYMDGDLNDQETRAFTRLIAESPEAAQLLAQFAMDEQHFRTTPASAGLDDLSLLLRLEESSIPLEQNTRPTPEQAPGKPHTLRESLEAITDPGLLGYLAGTAVRSSAAKWLAAAAVLLIATLIVVYYGGYGNPTDPLAGQHPPDEAQADPPNTPPLPLVATLTAEHQAVWERRPGQDLYAGQRFTLTKGFAEVTTTRGAVAVIEAPATIELLDNDNALYLHAGKLVGVCQTESSKGFVVKTEHAVIVDIGTEFGVTAGPDRVESTVFAGEITVKTGAEPAKAIMRHQTARVSVGKDSPALVVDDMLVEGYTRRMPRPALVKTARVINGGKHQASIDPNGFYELALLYNDREYRLMPSPGQALPEALLGGDIVKMPVDVISLPNGGPIEVELTTDRPVTVYLLRPPNAKTDGWLEQDYVNTGVTIQIQGPGGNPRTCEVWQREATAAGTTTVAWDVSRRRGDGMYTLVVTPADNE